MKRRRLTNARLPEADNLPSMKEVGGLPHKYFKHYARQAYFLTLMGFTFAQMAQVFEVEPITIHEWAKRHPEFKEAVKKGRAIADGKVAHALFQRALGYSHPHEVILTNRVREYNDKGKVIREYTEPLRVETMKYYPPDTAAAVKWLKARQPDVWGTKKEIKGEITMHHEVDLSNFTTEELEVLHKLSLNKTNAEDIDFEEVRETKSESESDE